MKFRLHAALRVTLFAVVTAPLLLTGIAGCKPSYPRCDSDDACAEHGEICLNGQCQECRDDAACAAKYPQEHRVCKEGRCEAKPECKLDTDCASLGPNLICKNDKCIAECQSDADCSGGRKCAAQKCVSTCRSDTDCQAGESCVDGLCQVGQGGALAGLSDACRPLNAGDTVNLDMVQFEFNKYDLTGDARDQLSRVLACLKQAPASLHVTVEGHCDDRGTQEYNLALGEKRASAVYNYFKQMGLEPKRFTVRSKGENEPLCTDNSDDCFGKNRRVQFLQTRH